METSLEGLRPRKYQDEVCEEAKNGNVIAALDTGSGKTYIAVMLIRHMLLSSNKLVVFLVPSVSLSKQQRDFIRSQLPEGVRTLQLSGDQDMRDREYWVNKLKNECDVLVLTAQIFLNFLTHSIWSLDHVSLLIFDECHRARKNMPYNGILREYHYSSEKPKIFGMTASPIWNTSNAKGSLAELEKNMDAKVIGVDLKEYGIGDSAVETIQTYDPSHELLPSSYPTPTLHTCLQMFSSAIEAALATSEMTWKQIDRRYGVALTSLGVFAAEYYLYSQIMPLFESECNTDDDDEESILSSLQIFSAILLEPKLDWITPKVVSLLEILRTSATRLRGIIFVEQRHIAVCLSHLLNHLLKGVQSAYMLGAASSSEDPEDTVKKFRAGDVDLLVATSVAEEGLDFPACDLVIRFDSLQNMVAYIQSRGRARNLQQARFVVMLQKDDKASIEKYRNMWEKESEVKAMYTSSTSSLKVKLEDEDDMNDDVEGTYRQRFVVENTGAYASTDNAISVLNRLCGIIPGPHRSLLFQTTISEHGFKSLLRLPPSLSHIPSQPFVAYGASKKISKRIVSFHAVRTLYELGVFDKFMMPVGGKRETRHTNDDGSIFTMPEPLMKAGVLWPWYIPPRQSEPARLWLHLFSARVGLITGTARLSSLSAPPVPILVTVEQAEIMEEYTRLGIWYCNSSKPIANELGFWIVPLVGHSPDFGIMSRLLHFPYGCSDWSSFEYSGDGDVLVVNRNQWGKTILLKRVRDDILLDDGHSYEFFREKWTRPKWEARLTREGGMLEVEYLTKFVSFNAAPAPVRTTKLIPKNCCAWVYGLPSHIRQAYESIPVLGRVWADWYRVDRFQQSVCRGKVQMDRLLLLEALMIPSTSLFVKDLDLYSPTSNPSSLKVPFNNQRLETLGDAVLEVCTSVHLYISHPFLHEGQLTNMRKDNVSNKFLMWRALEIGMDRFVGCSTTMWPFVSEKRKNVSYARRSLQDCMEATLGAAFLSGGMDNALRLGISLGLTVGGESPWHMRDSHAEVAADSHDSILLRSLQDTLGYQFRNIALLKQAITHPSFIASSSSNSTPSYERLEWLGDAVLNLSVMQYLYASLPATATSGLLSQYRHLAVCASTLSFIGLLPKFRLHKIMLVNNAELSTAIFTTSSLFDSVSTADIVQNPWSYTDIVPKAISDVLEAIVGAIFIDSGWNWEWVHAVVTNNILNDTLNELVQMYKREGGKKKLDPVSALKQFVAQWGKGEGKKGCRATVEFKMRKQAKKVSAGQPFEGMSAIVHNTILAGPIASAQSKAVTRFVVAQRALDRLRESESDTRDLMNEICDCYQVGHMEVRDEVEVEKELLEDSDDDGASLYYSFPDDDNYQDI